MLVAVECTKVKNNAPVVARKVVYCKHEKCKLKSHLSLRWGTVFVYYRKNLNSILKYQKISATIVLVLNLQAATMVYSVEYYLFLSTIGGILWLVKKIK